MVTGLIIHKKKGSEIPDAFLSKACEVYPHGFGIMYRSIRHGLLLSPAPVSDIPNNVKDVREKLKVLKDVECLIHFRKGDALHRGTQQPYIVLDTNETQIPLAGFMATGNFPNYVSDGKDDPEWYLCQDHLRKEFEVWDDAGYSPEEAIQDGAFERNIRNIFQDKASCIAILTAQGHIRIFNQKGHVTAGFFPWGWASNHLGMMRQPTKTEETSTSPMVSKVLEQKGHGERRRASPIIVPEYQGQTDLLANTGIVPPTVTREQMQQAHEVVVEEAKVEGDHAEIPGLKQVEMRAPELNSKGHRTSRNEKREWYNYFTGGIPQGYKNRPLTLVWVREGSENSPIPYKEIHAMLVGRPSPKNQAPAAPAPAETPPTQVHRPRLRGGSRPVPRAPAVPKEEAPPAPAAAPTVTGATPVTLSDKVRKIVGIVWKSEAGKAIPNPSITKKLDENRPTFSEMCDIEDFSVTFEWTPEFLIDRVTKSPEEAVAVVELWNETRNILINILYELNDVKKERDEFKDLVEVNTEPAKKTDDPIVEETPQEPEVPETPAPPVRNRPGRHPMFRRRA